MTTRTKRLGLIASGLADTYQAIYTVPAAKVAIVKSIRAFNGTGVSSRVYARVHTAAGVDVRIFDQAAIVAGTMHVVNDFIVLMAGDALQVVGTQAGWNWYVSGAELPA